MTGRAYCARPTLILGVSWRCWPIPKESIKTPRATKIRRDWRKIGGRAVLERRVSEWPRLPRFLAGCVPAVARLNMIQPPPRYYASYDAAFRPRPPRSPAPRPPTSQAPTPRPPTAVWPGGLKAAPASRARPLTRGSLS
eukprot:364343-Chlamydomonas_euryale.AAC.5